MSERQTGKPSPRRLETLLGSHFGAKSQQIILGPGPGLDAAVLDLMDGRVMAIAEDPIFPAAGLPLDVMGWFTVHIGASDVAVTGIRPQFMTYTLLLPPTCPEKDAATIIRSISKEAEQLGIAIAGGHTGWYDAVVVPIVGGVTVWGMADRAAWVSPGGAMPGDVLLMTKGPAIEAVALLALLYKQRIEKASGSGCLDGALGRVNQITVVEDALAAFASGGVHAMHDATEGGVLGGVYEMASAAGLAAHIDLDGVEVPPDIQGVAEALAFDPWQAISEGTLLAAVDPDRVPGVVETWKQKGIESFVLGRFEKGTLPGTLRRAGRSAPLAEPGVDPFWNLFFAGLQG